MPKFLLAAFVLAPLTAQAMVCRAPTLILRITVQDTACLIGNDTAIRRDTPGAVECLLSNPQLRIITLTPDGRFSYLDTDTDTLREGTCTPE